MSSKVLTDLQTNPNPETFQSCVSKADKLVTLFEEYENVISNAETSPMAAFWQTYLEMFELLLQFQKATKSGNWGLHLDSCEKLLPWFHAYDHHTMHGISLTIGLHSKYWQLLTQPCPKNSSMETLQSIEHLEASTGFLQIKL